MPEPSRRLNLVEPPPVPSSILPMRAQGLVYEIGGRRLIDGIDLVLTAGRRTVVIGPNGAGKSLILRLLHGLIEPTAGTIRWRDRAMDREVRLRQAMVFQRPVLLRRSVKENLDYVLRTRGVPAWDRALRVGGALRLGRLGHLARSPARVLSGGEQQRLALARALMVEPEILFLDEPSASLDPASTLAVEELVAAAHARGTSIVLVTHDVGQARRLADEVIFVHHGRIAEQTPAEQFFRQPASGPARAYLAGQIVI
ncbi:MAG: ATP-binding cassette domain-containing protein [Geminicoccaceae bacterium]